MEKLRRPNLLNQIKPRVLGEIHGDSNIQNILSRVCVEKDESEVLIDCRGVPLLDKPHTQSQAFERGDYCYDVSKVLFSLQGFSDIRRGYYRYCRNGDTHELEFLRHPGSDTMSEVAQRFLPVLTSNSKVKTFIEDVELDGAKSFELRTKLSAASHFVSDCACPLGRNAREEIVPLFLLGLKYLNDVVKEIELNACSTVNDPAPSMEAPMRTESADFGAKTIQKCLFEMQTSRARCPYDVLEFSVKSESASELRCLLLEMMGTYLPPHTPIYLSSEPANLPDKMRPCVLIHPSKGIRGQTHMLAAATRRTNVFFLNNGQKQDAIDRLRIIHVSSTGSSSHSQIFARRNDKLLSPGTFGSSPLELIILQAMQFPFPKPGRWVFENDSFCLLSRHLVIGGDDLCLLALKRSTASPISPWRMCVDETERVGGGLYASRFRTIQSHESEEKLMRTTTGLFLPHRLAAKISENESCYSKRTSPLMMDLVLPRFMERSDWIKSSHDQGYGVDSHLVWDAAESINRSFERVELADGGEDVAFYHYGSNEEIYKFLNAIEKDPRLESLAHAGAASLWLRRNSSDGAVN